MKLTCGLTFEQITKPCTYPNILELVVQDVYVHAHDEPPLRGGRPCCLME